MSGALDRVARERLKWNCRRGLLELDLVLERYLKAHSGNEGMDAGLAELLDLPDNDLWDIICGRSDRFEEHMRPVVERLRCC